MTRALTLVAVAAALVAGCGDEDSDAPDPAAPPGHSLAGEPPKAKEARTNKPKPAGTEITVGSSQFGEILFNGENQAIYLFDKESSATPECYGDCAAAWPPVLTDGEPQATAAAEQKLLGTTERDDGTHPGHLRRSAALLLRARGAGAGPLPQRLRVRRALARPRRQRSSALDTP